MNPASTASASWRRQAHQPLRRRARNPRRASPSRHRKPRMSPSRPFILRPVATSLLMVAILLAGAVAYLQLPVSALPQVDYPIIQVQTFYPGASPTVMVSSVTAPLERQFGQIPGLKQMTSTTSGGASIITLEFSALGVDRHRPAGRAGRHQRRLLLPARRPAQPARSTTRSTPPTRPSSPSRSPVTPCPLSKVEDLADTVLAQKISQLSGVGLVSIAGGQKPAVRIQANPIAARRLRPLARRHSHRPRHRQRRSGQGLHQRLAAGVHSSARTTSCSRAPRTIRNVIIAYRNGSPVRLKDVANAIDAPENLYQAAWVGKGAVAASGQRKTAQDARMNPPPSSSTSSASPAPTSSASSTKSRS